LGDDANEPARAGGSIAVIANAANPIHDPNGNPGALAPPDGPISISHLTVDGNAAGNALIKPRNSACIAFNNLLQPRLHDVAIASGTQFGLLLGLAGACDGGLF